MSLGIASLSDKYVLYRHQERLYYCFRYIEDYPDILEIVICLGEVVHTAEPLGCQDFTIQAYNIISNVTHI